MFKHKASLKPADCLARYVVTKHAGMLRGSYARVMCFSLDGIYTQNPEDHLFITNTYKFCGSDGDCDVESISVGGGVGDEAEFVLVAKGEKRVRSGPIRARAVVKGCFKYR